MRENADQNNSEYGHFLRNDIYYLSKLQKKKKNVADGMVTCVRLVLSVCITSAKFKTAKLLLTKYLKKSKVTFTKEFYLASTKNFKFRK